MNTIREQLKKWCEEDVDANTYITDAEIDMLEKIVCNITLKNSLEWMEVVKECRGENEQNM